MGTLLFLLLDVQSAAAGYWDAQNLGEACSYRLLAGDPVANNCGTWHLCACTLHSDALPSHTDNR